MSEAPAVVVFCGSRAGNDPAYREAALALGCGLARSGITLVYGGGRVGLMGAVADAALAEGGQVYGIIPEFLTTMEVAHPGLSKLIVTDSMHTRKRRMFELADAFVTLPGGLGTMDETVEIITWRQLRLHDLPIFVCDIKGWATQLLAAFESTIEDGFASESARALYEVAPDITSLLARLKSLTPKRHLGSVRL